MINKLKLIGRFLISRQFLKHVLISIIVVVALFWIVIKYLDSYTHFGDENYISVPDLTGIQSSEVSSILEPKGLRFQVDSVSTDEFPKGTVIRQDPGPTEKTGQYVKENRTIYLTVVSMAPIMVSLPDLEYKSKKYAESMLRIVGLKVKYTYKPYADCKDCVIEQLYNKKPVNKGDKVVKGSVIELVLGQGKGNSREFIPDLVGKTIDQANSSLGSVSFSLFAADCEGCLTRTDSLRAKIVRQTPGAGVEAAAGSQITVWRSMKTPDPIEP